MVIMVMIFIAVIATPANASTSRQVINLNKNVEVTITVNQSPIPLAEARAATTGKWLRANAKCVVKYYDIPLVRAFQYTVYKHWEYNPTRNRVRNADAATDPWINAALKLKGDYWEEYRFMDWYYSRTGSNAIDAHCSERHVKFHAIFGVKGVCLPIGTWYVNVFFRAFARPRSGSNQPWQCNVTQKWRYAD